MMRRLGNLLNSSKGIISGHHLSRSNITKDVLGLHAVMGSAGLRTLGPNGFSDDRVFAAYNIYKGKAALSAEPVAPTFVKRDSGGLSVKRSGYIMLSISPSKGERKYDWERKQRFALSATEVGSLVTLGPTGSCEFFHDPGMQTSNAGQVRKSLSIKANPEGNGYFISLNVVDSINKINERFTVPVTSAEFAVMRTSFSFALPLIIGWDRYSKGSAAVKEYSAKTGQQSFNSSKQKSFNSEWDR